MDVGLQQAFVYLAAGVVAAPIAARLGLGSVLGYLIAGAVVGPWALNLVGETERVSHVAEFGVVILLFLIGLEVRPALLWTLRTVIVGLGGAQLLTTGAVLSLLAVALGVNWREATAMGFILAMSSTAIVLQMLRERGLSRGAPGRAAFGVLLFQDLAVIPLLALLPLLAPEGALATAEAGILSGQPMWLKGIATVAAVVGVVIVGRYLSRPIFRLVARSGLRELFTASSLLLVIGVALLMQLVGLSPALGAFLAGVVLAESEFRRELETDIEPFRGLLLGLFFITVGAGLDFGLIAARPFELVGVVLGLMAVKGLVLLVVARVFRHGWRDSGTIAVALCQGGEFCFVLLAFAVGAHALRPELASLLTAAVALSMAATPLAMAAWLRAGRSPAEPAEGPENEFDERPPDVVIAGFGRFGQIVGRLLQVNGFRTSVLENSVEQITLLKRFGRLVYYGDAGRLDLLRAAGAAKARVLVVAVDDREKAADIVQLAKEEFPNLKVLARAFDRRHAYELMNRGADQVERETFEGGLALATETLRALGWRGYRAERAARFFRRHDERMMQTLRPLWGDEERFTLASRESSPRMDDLLRSDLDRMTEALADEEWDSDDVYDEQGRRQAPDAPVG
jgi:glutathione-regulated potassium-efflux system ancillary protein KefC/glutathione-regulated potassium-efflux system protein KefB